MIRVEWTNQAIDRIGQIADFIALDSPQAAIGWTEALFAKEEFLQLNPRVGRIVPEYNSEEIREIILGNYRLVYRIQEEVISVLTVKSCRQKRPET